MDVTSQHHVPECLAFGDLLRSARERSGITLQQIADETKIPRRHLESLERGQLTAIPGGTYTRGEVIAYTNVVRLDRQVALAHLERALHPMVDATTTSADAAGAPSTRRRLITPLSAAASLLIVVALSPWFARARVDPSPDDPHPVSTAATTRPPETSATPSASAVVASPAPAAAIAPSVAPAVESPAPANPERAVHETADPAVGAPAPSGHTDFVLGIVSEPPGARVTVDGIGRGITPISLNMVSPGAKRIRLTLPGYRAAEQTVEVRSTGETTIAIALKPVTP